MNYTPCIKNKLLRPIFIRHIKLILANKSNLLNAIFFFITTHFIIAILTQNSNFQPEFELTYGIDLLLLFFIMEFNSDLLLTKDYNTKRWLHFSLAKANFECIMLSKIIAHNIYHIPIFLGITYFSITLFGSHKCYQVMQNHLPEFLISTSLYSLLLTGLLLFASAVTVKTQNLDIGKVIIAPFLIPSIVLTSKSIQESNYVILIMILLISSSFICIVFSSIILRHNISTNM